MDLFFYIAIVGATMLMLSKVQYKKMWDMQINRQKYSQKQIGKGKKQNNFLVKIKNSILYDLFYSQQIASINRKYGILMIIIGILGMLLFKTMAIILIILLLIVFALYLLRVIKNLIKSMKSY